MSSNKHQKHTLFGATVSRVSGHQRHTLPVYVHPLLTSSSPHPFPSLLPFSLIHLLEYITLAIVSPKVCVLFYFSSSPASTSQSTWVNRTLHNGLEPLTSPPSWCQATLGGTLLRLPLFPPVDSSGLAAGHGGPTLPYLQGIQPLPLQPQREHRKPNTPTPPQADSSG